MLKWISKCCKNQTTIVETKMIEKALVMKSLDLSHNKRKTFLALGMR